MKAVSLHQPWASLIVAGAKWIETRGYSRAYRGDLLICSTVNTRFGGVPITSAAFKRMAAACDPVLSCTCGHPADDHDDAVGCLAGCPCPRLDRDWLFGYALAVARLRDCLPMTGHHDIGDPECIVVHGDGTLDHAIPSWEADQGPSPEERAAAQGFGLVRIEPCEVPDGAALIRDVSDQDPFGDFRPGRWAWMLDDLRVLPEPIPVSGLQQLWDPANPGRGDRIVERVAAQVRLAS